MRKLILSVLLVLFIGTTGFCADITPNGCGQPELVDTLFNIQGITENVNLSDLDITDGSDNLTVTVTNSGMVNYGGVMEAVPATSDCVITGTASANGTTSWYCVTWDAANDTVEVTQSDDDATDISALVQSIDATNIPIGMLKIVNTSGSDFTLGTTTTSTSGIAQTWYDLIGISRYYLQHTIYNSD